MKIEATDGLLLGASIVAGMVGFWACCSLFAHSRRRPGRPMRYQCLYGWGAVFFAGATLLTINQFMGPTAPAWFILPTDHSSFAASFAAPITAWWILCSAGLAMQRAGRVWRAR